MPVVRLLNRASLLAAVAVSVTLVSTSARAESNAAKQGRATRLGKTSRETEVASTSTPRLRRHPKAVKKVEPVLDPVADDAADSPSPSEESPARGADRDESSEARAGDEDRADSKRDDAKPEAKEDDARDEPKEAPPALPADNSTLVRSPSSFAYVLGGAGVVGLGGYALLTYWGNKDNTLLVNSCAPNCSPTGVRHVQQMYRAANISAIAGAAALGTGLLVYVLTDGLHKEQAPDKEEKKINPCYALNLEPSRAGAMARFSGSF